MEDERAQTETMVRSVTKAARILQKEFRDLATPLSREPSSVLAGVIGGVGGTIVGIGASNLLGVAAVLTGPFGLILGAGVGIFAWRMHTATSETRTFERETNVILTSIDEMRSQLDSLPDDAPPAVSKRLWEIYEELLNLHLQATAKAVGTKKERPMDEFDAILKSTEKYRDDGAEDESRHRTSTYGIREQK
jgi:hypothetical protein